MHEIQAARQRQPPTVGRIGQWRRRTPKPWSAGPTMPVRDNLNGHLAAGRRTLTPDRPQAGRFQIPYGGHCGHHQMFSSITPEHHSGGHPTNFWPYGHMVFCPDLSDAFSRDIGRQGRRLWLDR
ncbi:hypothetical protein [Thermomonospora amylolytica]|uniref:hypothetical protein n=1 Tax=Thermomonospora amylolytica TaxID=1411117 RepID=UPI0013006995|nr:hypothetical protein [Thermomonospora amylolytica]